MKTIIALIFILLSEIASAQYKVNNIFQNPDVAPLISEIQTPVSLSSGKLRIEIPLYTLQEGDITVPLSLSYDAGGIRVASHPGWVGQNWSLRAGGVISRVIKGIPDENWVKDVDSGGGRLEVRGGFMYSWSLLSANNWNTTSQITDWAKNYGNYSELESDEYIFNFCGHAGKFYIDHTGNIKVVGEEGYKIDILVQENMPLFNIYGQNVVEGSTYYEDGPKIAHQVYKCAIKGFKIIDPQGYQYYFGVYDDQEVYEKTSRFFVQYPNIDISTWYLLKIVSPQKNVVSFHYEYGFYSALFSRSYSKSVWKVKNNTWLGGKKDHRIQEEAIGGELILSPSLTSITTDNFVILFNSSYSTALDYDYNEIQDHLVFRAENDYDRAIAVPDHAVFGHFLLPLKEPFIQAKILDTSLLKWKKLDEISIQWKNSSQPPIRYLFNYREVPDRRLQLKTIRKVAGNLEEPPYTFTYDGTVLPYYLDVRTDHWGYYNGVAPSVDDPVAFYNYRAPSATCAQAEILKQITYPTGGYKKFKYELNTYSKVVKRDVNTGDISLAEVPYTTGGGLRISEIKEKADQGEEVTVKRYEYAGGILNGEIQYYWPEYKGRLLNNTTTTYTVERFYTNSILPVSDNLAGGVVSYSQVTEKVPGFGKTEYVFTNHDTHPDENAVSIDPQKSAYSPLTSRAQERGRLKTETIYNEAQKVIKKTSYEYFSQDASHYIRNAHIYGEYLFSNPEINAVEGAAFKIYTDPVLLKSKKEEWFDDTYPLSMSVLTNYTYNELYQVAEEEIAEYKNDAVVKYRTKNEYVVDYLNKGEGNQLLYWSMVRHNLLTPLVAQTKFCGNKQLQKSFYEYDWGTDSIPFIRNEYTCYENNVRRKVAECKRINKKGHPIDVIQGETLRTIYLWGYHHQYLIAEIKNATYEEVTQALGTYTPEQIGDADGAKEDALFLLRERLPQALITIYTYHPLYGRLSVEDPSGRRTAYVYDQLGRLKEVRDDHYRLLENYEYHVGE